jgi:hypothetical protein
MGRWWALVPAAFFCNTVFAADLRIVDTNGLTRAMQTLRTSGSVIVKLRSAPPTSPVLSRIDGISPQREGRGEGTKFLFEGLEEGTWKLELPPTQIREVTIHAVVP